MSTQATRIILVRHGQTVCNVRDIWHGWDDCELTEEGFAQARAAGAHLAHETVSALYCSDSRRARQTAEAIAQPHGIAPIPTPGLRERNAGEFEGMHTSDVVSRHPTIWEERAADYWMWRPPGGESFREVLARSQKVVEMVRAKHPGETVVLATHMGPVRVLISTFAGIPIEDTYSMPFPSTGVSVFSVDGSGARVEVLNDATHLQGDGL